MMTSIGDVPDDNRGGDMNTFIGPLARYDLIPNMRAMHVVIVHIKNLNRKGSPYFRYVKISH